MLFEVAGENIRNLKRFELQPGSGLNLIVGKNAAGKTSLLEAIHLLSVGRSFRTPRLDEVVRSGAQEGWVRGRVRERRSDRESRLALRRAHGQTECRIDGEAAGSASQLARYLPVQVLHPDSHRLLTGGPAYRRAFIDWGCFYQDTKFFTVWSRFRRVLWQRNAALKGHANDRVVAAIEHEFCSLAAQVDAARHTYVGALREGLREMQSLWPGEGDWQLDYRRGWGADRDLSVVLRGERDQAQRVGHSLSGPQRADLVVRTEGERVAVVFSRGQIKRAAAALMLAQIRTFERATARDVLILVDDLPSELDSEGQGLLLNELLNSDRQCFVTALSLKDFTDQRLPEHRMFHVEHGQVSELV